MRVMQRLLGLILSIAGVVAHAEWSDVPIRSATLTVAWHDDSLRELRLVMPDRREWRLTPSTGLRLALRHGQSAGMHEGHFAVDGPWAFVLDGRRHALAPVHLAVVGDHGDAFVLRDAEGRDWLRFDHAHPQPRQSGTVAKWRHFDVRVGAALARRLGDARLAGVPLGSAALRAELAATAKAVASCVAPNFPSVGNFQVDVALTAIDTADAVCNGNCNGAGAAAGRVKLTPSAKLQGVGSADVPWYRMFTTSPHAYPYPGNDQHPFLVWSVYRIDGDGRIAQLARSGVKHAFFSSNEFPGGGGGCGCGPANVLWSGCTDTYGWSTNDSSAWLSARREIVPARGQWGRCGSLRDADCNGSDDGPFIPGFDLRAVVAEAELVPALHPGAQWFLEAWYVVRDDVDVDNSFGHRRITPRWVGATSKWMLDFSTTPGGPQLPFASGPVVDAWVARGATSPTAMSRDASDAHGRLRLAVRTTDLGGGRWRYDYALMNIDHTRAEVQGSEPNLRVLANDGPIAFLVPLSPFASAAAESHDGDLDIGNDWGTARDAFDLQWTAPSGGSMPWGALYRFSLVANLPPAIGQARIQPGGSGAPVPLTVETLVPDAGAILFADGLE